MIEEYLYLLDSEERIIDFKINTPANRLLYPTYLIREFYSVDIESIELGAYTVIDDVLTYKGKTSDELQTFKVIQKLKRIDFLKKYLKDTDWKATVNAEKFQQGEPLKYPTLAAERQAWRDEINLLEAEILALES